MAASEVVDLAWGPALPAPVDGGPLFLREHLARGRLPDVGRRASVGVAAGLSSLFELVSA